MPTIATIGFAKKNLKEFLYLLKNANVTCLIDTRLNNTSQLSGFAKKQDLEFLLEEFMNIQYIHRLDLAPTKNILTEFKSKEITWEEYTAQYLMLLKDRKIDSKIDELFGNNNTICFLCSEHKHHFCHRSLLADYIKESNKEIKIIHL